MRLMMIVVGVALFAGVAKAEDVPSYKIDVAPLLQKYCVKCHGGMLTKAGYSVKSYDRLFKTLRGKVTLVKGQPERSLLLTTMDGTRGKRMPPLKHKIQPTESDISVIRLWIKAGAKND
jgi:hypothetical protein